MPHEHVRIEIAEAARPYLRRLLERSDHPTPILAIVWMAREVESERTWGWEVWAFDRAHLSEVAYTEVDGGEFTLYCTSSPRVRPHSELWRKRIDVENGKLGVVDVVA